MLLRVGVRHNNCEAILTAESKLIDLFFIGNHLVYREIMFDYIKSEKFMPKEVLHKSFAVSRTGRTAHYQGGDAVLEEINKAAKKGVIGVPSFNQWQRSFRNLEDLSEVKHKVAARKVKDASTI